MLPTDPANTALGFASCCFSLPNVRTRNDDDRSRSLYGNNGSQSLLSCTPHGDLELSSFILSDYPDSALHSMSADILSNDGLFGIVKAEPFSPVFGVLPVPQTFSFGAFNEREQVQPVPSTLTPEVQRFLQRASELQLRYKNLWERENQELERGAALRIIQPLSSLLPSSPTTLMPEEPSPGRLLPCHDLSNPLGSPPGYNVFNWHNSLCSPSVSDFQYLVHAQVNLLEGTPTKCN
ncbi:hypothetical protein CEUSTIGMA_g5066.t1 [Chlamydomonas eustigma]|uniref:Uncharacterized protein n=1 Tax=Chlamydomonas eustigma TaxID=1157962 RepID=A0A250X3G9_9CHLO|nr:hypothetical protein CEUSTIGMA_g5066.t1 [Chlamydomonas eustigma]|eukprot:GAX77623.1 hypothetical protein CEUSTIGMA_g5066.t1 [Chlamydomonas eustigma]